MDKLIFKLLSRFNKLIEDATENTTQELKNANLPNYCSIKEHQSLYYKYFNVTWEKLAENHEVYKAYQERLHNYLLYRNEQYISQLYNTFLTSLNQFPTEGEFLILKNGSYDRFTHAWSDGIQIGGTKGSFYFGGYCSYSGSLDPSVKYNDLKLTNQIKLGSVWIFDNNDSCAHNGFTFKIPFRVWELI